MMIDLEMERSNESPLSGSRPTCQSTSSQPAKRPRYTPIACDECKRRKIKCDGETPCHRCARHPTTCIYTQRGNATVSRQEIDWERMNDKIAKLQDQIDLLISNAAASLPSAQQQLPQLEGDEQHASLTPVSASVPLQTASPLTPHRRGKRDDIQARRKTRAARKVQYMGPTSSTFTLGVARTSLREMGMQPFIDLVDKDMASHSTTPARSPQPFIESTFCQNPLASISRNEAIRLVKVYEEESGTVYPFIDINSVLSAAERFYGDPVSFQGASLVRTPGNENTLSGGIQDILKLVIAIALVFEGHGPTRLSRRLLESIESGFEGRLCGPMVDIIELRAWTLMSVLQFHCDEEAVAWRTIGLASRAAIELGLHRQETYSFKFTDPQERLWANKLFWCIYVLDKRWSFGTGLPFALHDDDLDPDLSEPADSNTPLLKTMIAYGRLGSKVWKVTSNLTASVDAETRAFLDFQVRQWRESIAPELQLNPTDANMFEGHSRTRNRLRVLLYLRANQMRLLIFRRTLMSPNKITSDVEGAQQAVHIAKDTIRILDRLNRASDIYSTQQTSFNYFLVSALATILLAVCHATAKFNQSCREEFNLALELVRGFSTNSHVARRLWKTIRHMKVVGPKLGILPTEKPLCHFLNPRQEITFHQVSNSEPAASFMGCSLDAEHATDVTLGAELSPTYDFLRDGNQLSDDLTNLFEAIGPSFGEHPLPDHNAQESLEFYTYGTTDGLTRSLLDLV